MITRVTAHDPTQQPMANKLGEMLDRLFVEYMLDNVFQTGEPPSVKEWWAKRTAEKDKDEQSS